MGVSETKSPTPISLFKSQSTIKLILLLIDKVDKTLSIFITIISIFLLIISFLQQLLLLPLLMLLV
ncbi:MAG: hypothetical protein K0R31_627 [Clostridiales bacterium]|nr:hypothetical protein [Clostridiales bacterium]